MKPTVIVERDAALPVTNCTVGFELGSLVDPKGKEGASALLFRLLRRGVEGLSPTEVEQRLDSLGASVGADVARSASAMHGTCLSRSWEPFANLLIAMLSSAPNSLDEFRRLKAEATAEWVDSLDNDAHIARRFFTRKIFGDHPYSRLTSGTAQSLERIELRDVENVYQQLITRQRLIASFSGDISQSQADDFVSRLAAALPSADNFNEAPVVDPVVQPGRRLYFVDKPERSQVQILIGGSGAHPKDTDRTALYVGNTIFGGTFSSRLSREVRGKRGWSYGAYSQLAHDRARQSFSMWTFPQASDAAACLKLELSLLENLIEKGVSKSELSAAKKYLQNSHAFAIDTASKRAALAFDQKIYDLPPLATFKDRVSNVTVDQVNEALKSRLSASNLAIVVLGTKEQLLSAIEGSITHLIETQILPFDSPE